MLRSAPLPAHAHEHAHTTTPSLSDAHDHHLPHTPSHPEGSKARPPQLDEPTLTAALRQLPKESVYRVKGFICFAAPARTPPSSTPTLVAVPDADSHHPWWILNWVFGRWELVRAPPSPVVVDEDHGDDEHGVVRLTVMGERGEVRRYAERLAEASLSLQLFPTHTVYSLGLSNSSTVVGDDDSEHEKKALTHVPDDVDMTLLTYIAHTVQTSSTVVMNFCFSQ